MLIGTSAVLSVRLVHGSTSLEGNVQIEYGGTWGSVCDDYWDILDARVVCHQLGYADAVAATRYAHFGIDSGYYYNLIY